MPSGTMANQLALRVLTPPGTEVLCGERAHVYRYEHAAAAANAGVQLRPLPDAGGMLDRRRRGRAPRPAAAPPLPPISALCVENTHMPASGRPWRTAELDAVDGRRARARARGPLSTAPASGTRRSRSEVAPSALAAGTDTTMFCLSKGLERAGRLVAVRRRATVIDEARRHAVAPRAAGCARRA